MQAALWSLFALFPPAVFVAIANIASALLFGHLLFRADRPFAVLAWATGVAFPLYLIAVIRLPKTRRFYLWAVSAWLVAVAYCWFYLVWRPWLGGGPWGW